MNRGQLTSAKLFSTQLPAGLKVVHGSSAEFLVNSCQNFTDHQIFAESGDVVHSQRGDRLLLDLSTFESSLTARRVRRKDVAQLYRSAQQSFGPISAVARSSYLQKIYLPDSGLVDGVRPEFL